MGIEIIRLGGARNEIEPRLQQSDLAQPGFQTFNVAHPAMSIWLMSMAPGKAIFPWWKYAGEIDDDLNALNQTWGIPNTQALFDCLFFSHFVKFAGSNFFTIFPGSVKNTGWANLKQMDRETFTRGQGCIYHLHGAFNNKLALNWVPFWEPQSMVRNPGFGSLWRIFSANTADDATRCLTFFSLSNPRLLPEVTNLLITKDDSRSEKLAALVDWFGMYTAPVNGVAGTAAVIYTQKQEVMTRLSYLQDQITTQITQAQNDLLAETFPRTALRIMSRNIAL